MHDNRSHPLLAQVPLTVSPFISLPAATTLPYTYKNLPSTLPQSSTGNPASSGGEKAKYVVSSSGHAEYPNDIIASCKAMQAYIQKLQDDADRNLKEWQEAIDARDLAEKRRIAPGWLDGGTKILEPAKVPIATGGSSRRSLMDGDVSSADASALIQNPATAPTRDGDELDRAFGRLDLKSV
ncbi:hypothetical protein BJ878DRAFT_501507 [Calycina marina]|uniref:Uncharacterized protein n=1 Tax=Calycina marina TaxID=1763456 RepID=A0A9P8CHG5_9HELO|nr:hypothetical protein BJ878DRAFT_501507 [Calycina marina]